MPFPVQLLTSRADCDAVLDALTLERRVFTVRDQVLGLQADQSEDRATDQAEELVAATASVTRLTPLVAGLPVDTDDYTTMNRLLTRAKRRVEDLTTGAGDQSPIQAFLKAVDVRQAAVQVPILDEAIAEVTAHRATLSA